MLVVAGIAALAAGIAAAVLAPQKLKAALEDMGVSAGTAGRIVSDLQRVFAIVKEAGQFLVSAVEQHWTQIKAVISSAVYAVQSVIQAGVAIAKEVWSEFGSTITRIAENDWSTIKQVIGNAVGVIEGIFRLIGDVIHGRWSAAWQDVKQILSNALEAVWAVLRNAVANAAALAEGIGKAIIHGIVSGLGGLVGAVGGAIHHGLSAAVHWAGGILHGSGEFMWTKHAAGIPMAQGIIEGFLTGSAQLPAKISSTLRTALESAKMVIQQEQGSFQTAFSNLAQVANLAFSTVTQDIQTPAEALLAKMQRQDQVSQLKQSLAQAQQAYRQAMGDLASFENTPSAQAGMTPDQVAAKVQQLGQAAAQAQQQVNAAERAIKEDHLQQLATAQRKHENIVLQLRQMSFTNQLNALEKSLSREGATVGEAHAAILKLFKQYGIDYATSGRSMGEALAAGLRAAMPAVEAAAHDIAKTIAKYLPHSPAEKGPLSKLPGWSNYLLPGLDAAVAGVNRSMGGLPGAPGGSLAATGGGRLNVTVQVQGLAVGTASEVASQLAEPISTALARLGNNGHPYWRNVNKLAIV